MRSLSVFFDITKLNDFCWRVYHVIHFFFLDLLYIRYNCAKFHYCRIWVTAFTEASFFSTLQPWAAPEMLFLNIPYIQPKKEIFKKIHLKQMNLSGSPKINYDRKLVFIYELRFCFSIFHNLFNTIHYHSHNAITFLLVFFF